MKHNDDNNGKCYSELDFKDRKKRTIYENNEKTIEQLDEGNLFNVINKKSIDILLNKM